MSAKKRSAVQRPVSDLKLFEEVDESFLKMVSELKIEEKALSVQQTNDLIPLSLDLIGNPKMKARANGMVIIAGQLRCANPEMRTYCEALCKRLGDAEVLNFNNDGDDDSYITYQRDLISAISSLQASHPENYCQTLQADSPPSGRLCIERKYSRKASGMRVLGAIEHATRTESEHGSVDNRRSR